MPSWTQFRVGKNGVLTFEYTKVLGGVPLIVGSRPISRGGTISPPTPPSPPAPPSTTYYRLLEDGSKWLLETGDNWLTEQAPPYWLLENSGYWLLENGGFIELEGTTADG